MDVWRRLNLLSPFSTFYPPSLVLPRPKHSSHFYRPVRWYHRECPTLRLPPVTEEEETVVVRPLSLFPEVVPTLPLDATVRAFPPLATSQDRDRFPPFPRAASLASPGVPSVTRLDFAD